MGINYHVSLFKVILQSFPCFAVSLTNWKVYTFLYNIFSLSNTLHETANKFLQIVEHVALNMVVKISEKFKTGKSAVEEIKF